LLVEASLDELREQNPLELRQVPTAIQPKIDDKSFDRFVIENIENTAGEAVKLPIRWGHIVLQIKRFLILEIVEPNGVLAQREMEKRRSPLV